MAQVKAFMGRKVVRPGISGSGSQSALLQQFNASMSDIMTNLNDFIEHVEGAMPEILIEVLEPTFGKALERTPVKNGSLRASGYLEARQYYQKAEVEIGFGRGGNPDYAIYVHEMPFAHAEPTRDKFLQSALDEDFFSILSSIPRTIREVAGT